MAAPLVEEKANILIVDDLPEKLLVFRSILEELGQNLVTVHSGSEALKEVLARNAIPEIGKMEDVSNVIDWLIRPESQAITGQVIFLGGA